MKPRFWIGAIGFVMLLAARHSSFAQESDWPTYGGDTDETRYSALEHINTRNVAALGLAWFLDLPDERMLEATPLAIEGVLYFTGSYCKVYAVEAATGKLLWTYDPQVWKHGAQKLRFVLPVNRGVAYADKRVFVGILDGRLVALDAKTGNVLWSVETTQPGSLQTITGAPRAFNGKVIIGNGGADFGARGYVTAYDQSTGRQAWRFYVVPGSPQENRGDPAMEQAATTWHGEFWKTGTGGGPWDNISFDRELNRLYVGTGNASPYDSEKRSPGGGDNLYTAAIVALDADSGKYLWHYQLNPGDSWDYDSPQQMTLTDLVIGGRKRKVLMQAPKNGFLYVIDRTDGKLISAGKIGKVTWADHIDLKTGRPVEMRDIRYQHHAVTIWPSSLGAHSWQAMAFSPRTGLLYIPYMQLGIRFAKTQGDAIGGVSIETVVKDAMDDKGALLAYDPVQQRARWKFQHSYFWNGGAVATGGGLVFQGTADGYFAAYDARSGKSLWRFNAGLGIIAAPITYSIRGVQYVSVLVGYGGTNVIGDVMNAGWKFGAQPRRLLTFALGGRAALPPSAPQDFKVHAVDDPSVRIIQADVDAGRVLYAMNCSNCHGLNTMSAGAPAPDLRESAAALDRDALWKIVHDGALLEQGMPRIEELDVTQLGQIYAFIRAKSREELR